MKTLSELVTPWDFQGDNPQFNITFVEKAVTENEHSNEIACYKNWSL